MVSGVAMSVFLRGRILDDIVYDWVTDAIWHQIRDATLWIQYCKPADLQPFLSRGKGEGAQFSRGARAPGHLLEPPVTVPLQQFSVTASFKSLVYINIAEYNGCHWLSNWEMQFPSTELSQPSKRRCGLNGLVFTF